MGATPTVAVYRVQRPMPCERSAGNRGPNSVRATACRSSRTSARSFLRVGPATVRAAERAMGWGKHFKIRPPDKEDAFPMERAEHATAALRANPRPTEGRILFEPPVQAPRTWARSFLNCA